MLEIISSAALKEQINNNAAKGSSFLFAVDFEMERGFFIENPLASKDVFFRLDNISNYATDSSCSDLNPVIKTAVISSELYREKFKKVREGLMRGDSYLVNLTCKTEIELNITFEEIFLNSISPFALYVPGYFVCFSPERFVSIESRTISCRPMKGTIKAEIPHAEKRILEDYKESSEHYTITDLIRNDIGKVSENVWVEKFRYIDRIGTKKGELLQVSSDIRGVLPEGYLNNLGDIIFSLLPAGSVSGAPKQSTLKIIADAEGEKRGFYTGIFGYFDGSLFDSAVLIRFIEKDNSGKMWYRSGGGVTVNSSWEEEYSEMIDKIYLPFK